MCVCGGGEGSGRDVFLCFIESMYFTGDRTDLFQEAIGPEGSDCFLRWSVLEFLRKL